MGGIFGLLMWGVGGLWRSRCGRDGTGAAGGFSISGVRTVRVHAACSGRTLTWGVFYGFPGFLVNVRPYQSACSRTAGHWLLENPPAAPVPGFWGRGDVDVFWFFYSWVTNIMDSMNAEKSARGPANNTPRIPKRSGRTRIRGIRKKTCLVSASKAPFAAFPMAVKKLEESIVIGRSRLRKQPGILRKS